MTKGEHTKLSQLRCQIQDNKCIENFKRDEHEEHELKQLEENNL